MFKKLMKKFNAEIKTIKVDTTTRNSGHSYYKNKYCNKCGCNLFTNEIMCPHCLNPVI